MAEPQLSERTTKRSCSVTIRQKRRQARSGGRGAVVAAMVRSGHGCKAKRLFLKLENIRGVSTAGGLKAYVNLPVGQGSENLPQDRAAGSAALFGLASASKTDGPMAATELPGLRYYRSRAALDWPG